MGNMTMIAVFIITLNVLMWFASIGMTEANPDGTVCYDVEDSLIGNKIAGSGEGMIVDTSVVDDLPADTSNTVDVGTGNIFTDVFLWLLNWLKSVPGLNYIIGMVEAPYNILKCMGLPTQFTVGIGTLWYLISFFSLIAFVFGRND